MEWDGLRFVLAVVRNSSLAAAAAELDCNPSTVTRRITALEEQLGVRLFDRLPGGYQATDTALEMAEVAKVLEQQVHRLDRLVSQKDSRLSGVLCVTLPEALVRPLGAAFGRFSREYPDIELEALVSTQALDLNRREADVAIRATYSPPEHLVGRRLVKYRVANYAAPSYLQHHDLDGDQSKLCWVGWGEADPHPQWVLDSPFPNAPVVHRVGNVALQLELCRAGLGLAQLPCFIAAQAPELVRLAPEQGIPNRGIWVLTHRDLRKTARVRAFVDFISREVQQLRPLFEGATIPHGDQLIASE